MSIKIKPIETFVEMRAVEDLQQVIWNLPDKGEVAPAHLMIAFQMNGGLLLGAYVDERLVGFSLGFMGMAAHGRTKFCSAMLGVLPAFRNRKLGEQLKWAQREAILSCGIDLITWTYDPLETRNARLNLHKLGAISNTYFENLYGVMEGDNAGLPSDRLQVDWWIASAHVSARQQKPSAISAPDLLSQGVPLLNPPHEGLHPAEKYHLPAVERVLLVVPASIQSLKQLDISLALAWRLHSRHWFKKLFAAGFVARDLHLDDNLCFYDLSRNIEVVS